MHTYFTQMDPCCILFVVTCRITDCSIILLIMLPVSSKKLYQNFFCLVIILIAITRQWHPTPVLLSGESHGWRSLVGCSPWSHTESDTTERLHFHFLLSCIEEGNGNPLQCSCLENPREGRAWWAAVYGVAQSRARLTRKFKWLNLIFDLFNLNHK